MKEILMEHKNEEGKIIRKGIPENLVSNYLMIGWEIVKEEKKENKPLVKDNKSNNE